MESRHLVNTALGIASSLNILFVFACDFAPGFENLAADAKSRRTARASSARKSTSASTRSHARGSGGSTKRRTSVRKSSAPAKPKYAYPLEFFMMKAPDFDRTPFDVETSARIKDAFQKGIADDLEPAKLVKAGIFQHYPLSGGIFNRREDVKYIVLHSTETGVSVPGKNVVNGWNSMGRRHPGAQYVVDRDGTIYQALDPKYGAVHVNIFKTLPGINNDNSIGIEMNHTGKQTYPPAQIEATKRLLTYLQQRFKVNSSDVITHKYAQQGDHTDPVNFDLEGFLAAKEIFRNQAIAMKKAATPIFPPAELTEDDSPLASVYVQIHGALPEQAATQEPGLESQLPESGSLPVVLEKKTGTQAGAGRIDPTGSRPTFDRSVSGPVGSEL